MLKGIKKVLQLLNMDRRAICQVTLFFCYSILMMLLVACNSTNTPPENQQDDHPEINVTKPSSDKNNECSQLDSKLYQLFLMEDPTPAAEQLGFRVKDGKVHVLLVLLDENTEIPEGFDLDVGTRVGDKVQVFVTFEALCDLANTDEVIAIRQPLAPILE